MTTEYIHEFLVLSEVLNISLAAERLSMTQATLSRHIQALELELDGILFERRARGVALSEAGKRFLPYAQNLHNIYVQSQSALFLRARELSGVLNIGVTRLVADYYYELYLDLLHRYTVEHPGIQINLTEGSEAQLRRSFQNGELDFALMHGSRRKQDGNCTVLELFRDSMVALLPAAHRLANCTSVSWPQLQNECFILPPVGSFIFARCLQSCRRTGFEPNMYNIRVSGPGGWNLFEKATELLSE